MIFIEWCIFIISLFIIILNFLSNKEYKWYVIVPYLMVAMYAAENIF